MNVRLLSFSLLLFFAGAAYGQRNQSVNPLERGDMVYLGPDASFACSAVTFFSNSNPCHVGMLTSSETVTEATSGVEPHAVHTLTLSTFQAAGYRSAMTTYPYTPSTAGRDTIVAYAAAKAARLSYYDANHLNQKGGYDGGCADGVAACWDGWDYFNEFDCVGLTERAYELAAAPDAEGPTPDYDPFNGCTWEGYFFIYPEDQYDSCKTTYTQAFPAVGAAVGDTVKHGFWRFYTVHIPAGVVSLSASTTSSTDVDLYVGTLGYLPSFSSYTCASESGSGNEQCTLDYPSAGGWSFGVYGYANTTSSFNITITQSGAPSALTGTATNITATTAQLRGTITANALTTTTAFDYGTTSSYGQTAASQSVSGSAPQLVSANVAGLACNTLYHFRVRGTNSGGTAYGGDVTYRTANCPVVFTDDPLVPGVTRMKALHVTELRSAINAVRTSAGLGTFTFADTISAGAVTVKASHILELRTAIAQTRSALGLPQIVYTNPILSGALIRAIDITEIRNAVR